MPELPLPHPLDKRLHIDDLDTMKVLKVSEVGVSGDDKIGLGLHCAGEELVIGRVFCGPAGLIKIRRCNRLFSKRLHIFVDKMIKEFESLPAAIAAYNAGESIVRKWQETGNYKSLDEFIEDIPYDETKNFAKRVITTYFEYLKSAGEKDMAKVL